DWKITGIDSGAGIMDSTNQAMEDYGLDDWTLVDSSEQGMISELKSRYADEKPIVITAWKPHWMFAAWDLHLLDDPEGSYGDADHISIGVNKELEDTSPAAYKILSNFTEDEDQLNAMMGP